MFSFRRFYSAAPLTKTAAASSLQFASPSSAAFCAAAAPVLSSSAMFQSHITSQQRRQGGGNNSSNSGNSNSGSSSNQQRDSSRPQVEYKPSVRWTSYTRASDAFLQLTHAVDKASSNEGYRLLVTFPQQDCTHMDIQFAPQVADRSFSTSEPKTAEEGEAEQKRASTDRKRAAIFGLPVSQLSVRVYPLQMAKIVSVLEGKANETVVASRLAIGTLKKGPEGSFVYTVQTRVTKNDSAAPSSIEAVLNPTHAYMLEKFFTKMLVAGFDPARDPMNGPSNNNNNNNRDGNNNQGGNNRGNNQGGNRRY